MSERKVINKYYPIDYDESKLKRVKKPKGASQQTKVRMALPMSVQCTSCSNFMARGSKFNARKETVVEEAYLGNPVYRFYFRCSKCFQELTMKTDPKNCDYVTEKGLKAGFVLHKAGALEDAMEAEEREKLENFDKMKVLEQKSLESLARVELDEAIDTVLLIQSKRAQMSSEELHRKALEALDPTIEVLEDDDLTEEDWAELEEMQQKIASRPPMTTFSTNYPIYPSNGPVIRRIDDEVGSDEEDEEIDPIALRSKLALSKLREKQLNSDEEHRMRPIPSTSTTPSSEESAESNSTTNNGSNSNHNINNDLNSNNNNSTPNSNASTTVPQKPEPGLSKPVFKMPMAKPIQTSTSTSASTAGTKIITTSTTSKAQSPQLLTTKKYSRRDDDE